MCQAKASRRHPSSGTNCLLGSEIQEINNRSMNSLPGKTMDKDTERLRSVVKSKGAGSLSSQEPVPKTLGAFLAESCSFSGMALLSLFRWHKTDMVILKMRAEFLSGRKRWLDLDDGLPSAWQECVGKEDKETTTVHVLSNKQKVGAGRED